MGNVYQSLGQYQKAAEQHQQSLNIQQEIGNKAGIAASLKSLGNVHQSVAKYQKAIEYYQQSLDIEQQIGQKAGVAGSKINIGSIYQSLGKYQKAIEYHQQGLEIAQAIGHRQWKVNALNNLGNAYKSLGQYQNAIKDYEQSLYIQKQIGDRSGVAASEINLAGVYLSLKQHQQAIEKYQRGLEIAIEVGHQQWEANALRGLGVTYIFLGQYQQANEQLSQSLIIAEEIGDRNGKASSLTYQGVLLHAQDKLVEAENRYRESIEISESLRLGLQDFDKVSLFDTKTYAYRQLQVLLVAENRFGEALELAERSRARALAELLASKLLQNFGKQLDTTFDHNILQEIKQIAQQHSSTLVEYLIIDEPIKVQDKQQWYPQLYIWVVKPIGEIAFKQVDLKSLNQSLAELVTNSRESIGVRGRAGIEIISKPGADEKQRLQQLHNLLIKPIADLLPSDPNAHVIFIPHRELFLVPFAALQDEQGKYLIEKHTILFAPSIQLLNLTRQKLEQLETRISKLNKFTDILIVGNPSMPSVSLKIGESAQKLSSLPGAEKEALEIATLFNTKAFIGAEATKTSIKSLLPKADIIHLATHGLLDYGQLQGQVREGVPGALALAPEEGKEDGLLTSGEIFDLELNASLVVLSACDTGRGDITSDGVIGLSRSFISAGTPSIIVSLWAIPDAPTSDLMKEFYNQLKLNPNKAQALRQAMLKMMKHHPHPKDWAAFTLIGETQATVLSPTD